MEIEIKKTDITYLKDIQDLNNQLFELEYNNFDSSLRTGWTFEKEGKDYFSDMLNNEIVYIALSKNKVVGYLAGSINVQKSYITKSLAEIDNMFILEEYRQYGIGTKLIDKFKEYCLNNQIEELKVATSAKNKNAINFYMKNGFNEYEITFKQKMEKNSYIKSNIFILHSLNGDTIDMWGQDIKETFNKKNVEVFLPQFPIRENSTYDKFKIILSEYFNNGKLNKNSIVICHSIGNAYFIRFCKEMNYIPKVYIAVAPGAVYNIPSKRNDYTVKVKKQAYCKKEQLDFVKENIQIKYCLYSDEGTQKEEMFKRFIEDTSSKAIYLKYYNHFDGYHRIYRIPELIQLLNEII